jgi:peroxiredoxin
LAASTVPISAELAVAWDAAQRELGVRRAARLVVHPTIASPLCAGLVRPTVVWPIDETCPLTAVERRAALVHELSHLRHYDDWVRLAAELWRAACWWYLPVHWCVARLRREQEFLCDDAAADEFEQPERYAQMLMNLARVCVSNPLLGTSLSDSSTLVRRVRRILKGDLRVARPLGRRRAVLLGLVAAILLVGAGSVRLVALVRADEGGAADAPLDEITPAELAQRLRKAVLGYKAGYLEAEFADHAFLADKNGPSFIDLPGRFRYVGDGNRWRAEQDSKMISHMSRGPIPVPHRWTSGFDGELHYAWDRDGWVLGQERGEARTLRPTELFFHELESFVDGLETSNTRTAGQATIDGYRCFVLEHDSADNRWHSEWLVSPRQSYLVVRAKRTHDGKVISLHELHDLQRTPRGAWFPRRIVTQWGPAEHEGKLHFTLDRATRVTEFEPGREFADGYFQIDLSYGEPVRDYTTGNAYLNDPWWPDVREVAARFGWPRPDLSPLTELRSDADPDLDGMPAPPIEPAEWVHGEATDLEALRGNVTLLYFFGGESLRPTPEQWAALRRLYEVYHPAGLEMIGIAGSSSQPRQVAQTARELRLPCPVAVDAQDLPGRGKTFTAYGLKSHNSTVLIDHEGRMRHVKQNCLVADLARLLKEAGAEDVKPITTDHEFMSFQGAREVNRAFHEGVRRGRNDGTLRGTVTNGEGPFPMVEITASLRLRMLTSSWTPSAVDLFPYGDRAFQTRTKLDGSYELTGLPKGSYELSVVAEGKAVVIRDVMVTTDFALLTADAVLEQDDGLAGVVRDEEGRPLGGVTIRLIKRHADPSLPEGFTSWGGGGEATTTDAAGRFEFKRLQTGSYSFDITAEGFRNQSAENIATGSKGVKVTMQRSAQ